MNRVWKGRTMSIRMVKWVDGWVDECMDGWMGGLPSGWIEGWVGVQLMNEIWMSRCMGG